MCQLSHSAEVGAMPNAKIICAISDERYIKSFCCIENIVGATQLIANSLTTNRHHCVESCFMTTRNHKSWLLSKEKIWKFSSLRKS